MSNLEQTTEICMWKEILVNAGGNKNSTGSQLVSETMYSKCSNCDGHKTDCEYN